MYHNNELSSVGFFVGFRRKIKQVLIETCSAELAVLPLLIFLFGFVSIVSPLANVLALLAVPYAMGFGFFATVVGFVSLDLGRVIGVAAWALLAYILTMVRWCAAIPYASVELGFFGIGAIMLAYGVLIWRLVSARLKKENA